MSTPLEAPEYEEENPIVVGVLLTMFVGVFIFVLRQLRESQRTYQILLDQQAALDAKKEQ